MLIVYNVVIGIVNRLLIVFLCDCNVDCWNIFNYL